MIQDTPWPGVSTPECVAAHSTELSDCQVSRAQAIVEPARRDLVGRAAAAAGVTVVDPVSWFCTAQACPMVVGNILVWHDYSHMSTSFSAMLAPLLDRKLPL
jgi:hypothetical protein